MEQLQKNISEMDAGEQLVVNTVQSSATPTVGQCLRAARIQQGMTVEDVVNKIKLAPRQVEALETDNFESLPELAFVRGFVRSYAKLLQLDDQPLLNALPGAKVLEKPEDPLHVEAPFPTARSLRQSNVNLLIAALLISLFIAGFVMWQSRMPSETEPSVVAQSPEFSPLTSPAESSGEQQPIQPENVTPDNALVETPLPLPEKVEMLVGEGVPAMADKNVAVTGPVVPRVAANADPATANVVANPIVGKDELRMVFSQESWVEVADQNGKSLSRQVQPSGGVLSLRGSAPLSLVIGHASSVQLSFRGKPVDLAPYTNATSDVARLTLE